MTPLDMRARFRAFDWSATPLGPIDTWPAKLVTFADMIFASRHAMFLIWGPGRTIIYNDAYAIVAGAHHPRAFGTSVYEAWPEIRDDLVPLVEGCFAGQAIKMNDILLMMERNGVPEEAHFDFSYTPVADAQGQVEGLLGVTSDTTAGVIAKREAEKARDQLAQLFEQGPSFMAMLRGPTHRIEMANAAYLRLVGDRAVVGKTVAEALPDAAAQGYLKLLDEVYRSGVSFSANGARYAMAVEPGAPVDERHVDFIFQAIRDPDGSISGIFVEGVDVTERTRAARRLDELNRESSIVGGRFWGISPDLLSVVKADGYLESLNPAWEKILGWSEAELRARPVFEFIHPDDREPTFRALAYLTEGNPILRFENRYLTKSGALRWIAWSATPLGEAFYAAGRDITFEKEQAAALVATTADRDRIWSLSSELMLVATFEGVVVDTNPAWLRVLGWSREEMAAMNGLDLVHPDDIAPSRAEMARLALGHTTLLFENRYRHRDGSYRWFAWTAVPHSRHLHAVGRDITEIRAAAATLRDTEDALRQAQKMEAVGQLTGGIAHDFNNLLQGIVGSVELVRKLMERGRYGEVDRYLGSAMNSANRAAGLTHRLLAFSRRQPLDPKAVNVNRLISSMEELLRRSVPMSIRLELVLAGGLWNTLCDANQVENSILNLVINARDAMPDGGQIVVETANSHLDSAYASRQPGVLPGQYVCISVSDSGTGMTPDVVARAFDPFFTTKPVGQGTGLGLSMVYGFARQSLGSAKIYSELGKGTTIKLYLPRHRGEENVDALAVEQPVQRPPIDKKVILVIEDEETVRSLVVVSLEELGYHVLEAADGPAGLAILQSSVAIDMLVTDIGLPGLNGRQVADAARLLRPRLKVLFMTGYAENAAVANGFLEPDMQMITKPFAMDMLMRRVTDMVEKSA